MSNPPRVLVVDDEKLIRWSVSERLTRKGYQVSAAESGERALELLATERPQVMLLDVRLPGIDGIETLRRALVLQPDVVVVMMSAHGTVDIAVEGMKRGAVDFLSKPFPLAMLDAAVARAHAAAQTRRLLAGSGPEQLTEASAGGMVGSSPAIERIRAMVGRIAASDFATVLVEGESGTGKEVVARAIHVQSARASKPFLCVNCAALPEHLLESELFGHERGAYTDAREQKAGLFEAAAGGTVMLDEVGDLPPGGQAKLLRLLENRTFRRVGGVTEIQSDVRVVAATNANLEQRVSEGRFRADLYFRLNVVRIEIPPLHLRREDVPLLAAAFIARYNEEMKRKLRSISQPALAMMDAYRWPGNVRELRNVIERALILHGDIDELRPEHLPEAIREAPPATHPALHPAAYPAPHPTAYPAPHPAPEAPHSAELGSMERQLICEALKKSGGNQSEAARLLGVSRDTLRYRQKRHAIE